MTGNKLKHKVTSVGLKTVEIILDNATTQLNKIYDQGVEDFLHYDSLFFNFIDIHALKQA